MAANERRRTNHQTTLLWYILNHGLGQIQTSIFLGRWLELQPPELALIVYSEQSLYTTSIQSHMVSYCSTIKINICTRNGLKTIAYSIYVAKLACQLLRNVCKNIYMYSYIGRGVLRGWDGVIFGRFVKRVSYPLRTPRIKFNMKNEPKIMML